MVVRGTSNLALSPLYYPTFERRRSLSSLVISGFCVLIPGQANEASRAVYSFSLHSFSSFFLSFSQFFSLSLSLYLTSRSPRSSTSSAKLNAICNFNCTTNAHCFQCKRASSETKVIVVDLSQRVGSTRRRMANVCSVLMKEIE